MRFKFVILRSSSFVLESSFIATVVKETGSRIFLVFELFEVLSERKVWAAVLGITSAELDEHKGCSGSEHPSLIQIFLITYAKFFANWVVPKKIKWSPFPANTSMLFGWKWKLNRRIFIDVVSTCKATFKQRL